MIRINIQDGGFTRNFLAVIQQTRNPRGMLLTSGRELANRLKTHFRLKDRIEANRLSPRRSHFWLAVSRTVSSPFQSGYNAISVSVNHPGIAQKVFGGTIVPKFKKALTIPVSEEAYGRTARTFERETGLKLFLLRTGKGEFQNAVLATKRNGGIQVEYILTRSVTQAPDPTALPPQSELEAAILARAEAVLQRESRDAFLGGGSATGQ